MHKYSYVYLNIFNITRIANAVQRHSLLSGHYDCNVLRFSIVRNVKYHQWLKALKSLNVFVIVFVFVVVFLLVK